MTQHHKTQISQHLDKLQDEGIIDYYVLQSKMPGLRWSISVEGKSTFSYNTGEILAFLRGIHVMQGKDAPLLAR